MKELIKRTGAEQVNSLTYADIRCESISSLHSPLLSYADVC